VRLVLRLKAPRRILKWPQRILFAGAAAMLGYCAFAWIDTAAFQQSESRQLERLLADARPVASPTPPEALPVAAGGLLGRIEIPRLGISAVVIEGTGRTTLRRAVGHVSGTAVPGEPGNVGISGHRDTFFRPLRNIRQDDIITVTTLRGEYRYQVISTKIVAPSDVAVLDPTGGETLTLITCYPFYFVGAAPDRFIVQAERIIR